MAKVNDYRHKNKHQLFLSISFIKYEQSFCAYWLHNVNKEKSKLNILLAIFVKHYVNGENYKVWFIETNETTINIRNFFIHYFHGTLCIIKDQV